MNKCLRVIKLSLKNVAFACRNRRGFVSDRPLKSPSIGHFTTFLCGIVFDPARFGWFLTVTVTQSDQ